MNTEEVYETDYLDLAATKSFASDLAGRLKGGEIFELVSDLGGGKTTFVSHVVAALGCPDVSSPSFTIHNEYSTEKFRVHHYDFYRLESPGVVAAELQEILFSPDAVTFIEWGESIHNALPSTRVVMKIKVNAEEGRKFTCSFSKSLAYLFKENL